MEEILTAEQVAQILQVHPFTVLKFIKQGKLKASKLGRVYRIRKSDVDSFLDGQAEEAEKAAKKKEPAKYRTKEPEEIRERRHESKKQKKEKVEKKTAGGEIKEVKRDESSDIDHYIIELKTKET